MNPLHSESRFHHSSLVWFGVGEWGLTVFPECTIRFYLMNPAKESNNSGFQHFPQTSLPFRIRPTHSTCCTPFFLSGRQVKMNVVSKL